MRVLAVDTGARRVGFAVSTIGDISMPFTTKEIAHPDHAVRAIVEVAKEAEAEMILIGLPLNMDGTLGEMAEKCKVIGAKVADETGLPVKYWDERLSTVSAERIMLEGDLSRQRRKQSIDKLSAQIFLQSFLDSGGAG